jgi:hypothetical protein
LSNPHLPAVGLSEADCGRVCRYASERIGLGYDFKNVIDLMRYLFPCPVTQRGRHRTIALGSRNASRIICSSRIAQEFDAVHYPILPKIMRTESQTARREIADSSLYAPREFDISPHFMAVKPTFATIKTCIGLIFFGFTPQRIERVHDREAGSPSGLPLSVPT